MKLGRLFGLWGWVERGLNGLKISITVVNRVEGVKHKQT